MTIRYCIISRANDVHQEDPTYSLCRSSLQKHGNRACLCNVTVYIPTSVYNLPCIQSKSLQKYYHLILNFQCQDSVASPSMRVLVEGYRRTDTLCLLQETYQESMMSYRKYPQDAVSHNSASNVKGSEHAFARIADSQTVSSTQRSVNTHALTTEANFPL